MSTKRKDKVRILVELESPGYKDRMWVCSATYKGEFFCSCDSEFAVAVAGTIAEIQKVMDEE